MSTHKICLYEEVDKKYTGCNLKTTKLLDCVLIGVCAVIRSNMVCTVCYLAPIVYIDHQMAKSSIKLNLLFLFTVCPVCVNSVNPGDPADDVVSHQGWHCLPLIQQFLDTTSHSKLYLFKF